MSIHQLDDRGVANLMCGMIESAKDDFRRAYLHYKQCVRDGAGDYDLAQAARMYRLASSFFYQPLFTAYCPMDSKQYIQYLIKEIEKDAATA